MAGTEFNEIFDNFMMTVEDYRLIALFNTSETDFSTYLSGWLIQAIPEFTNCDQSLDYSSSTFTETLTQKNITILALLMKKKWFERELENILQMTNVVQDRDFKMYSQANNMKEKRERLITLQEELSQKLVDYGLNYSTDWANWLNGVYFVP
jgi:hypothetical protein